MGATKSFVLREYAFLLGFARASSRFVVASTQALAWPELSAKITARVRPSLSSLDLVLGYRPFPWQGARRPHVACCRHPGSLAHPAVPLCASRTSAAQLQGLVLFPSDLDPSLDLPLTLFTPVYARREAYNNTLVACFLL